MRSLILLFILFTTVTGQSQEEQVEVPQIAIRIPLGKTIEIDETLITFERVVEDSRCPRKVQCVWAGRARVEVVVEQEDEEAVSIEVIMGQVKQNEVANRTIVEKDDYIIDVINLTPYPEEPGMIENYWLLIRKIKNDQ